MIRKIVLATAMIFLLIAVILFASRAQAELECDQSWTVDTGNGGKSITIGFITRNDSPVGIEVEVIDLTEGCTVAYALVGGFDLDAIECDRDGTALPKCSDGQLGAPPQKVVGMTTLKNFFQEAGMSKKHAQELVNKTVREIKLKKPGEEGERLIRLITQQPSPTKPRKLATKWAKIKSEH